MINKKFFLRLVLVTHQPRKWTEQSHSETVECWGEALQDLHSSSWLVTWTNPAAVIGPYMMQIQTNCNFHQVYQVIGQIDINASVSAIESLSIQDQAYIRSYQWRAIRFVLCSRILSILRMKEGAGGEREDPQECDKGAGGGSEDLQGRDNGRSSSSFATSVTSRWVTE